MKEAMLREAEPMPPQDWPVAVPARVGGLDAPAQAVPLTEPVDHLDRVQFERFAAPTAADSGGVQRKAFFHQVPCVTLRAETEWVELVEVGWNRLAVPEDSAQVVEAIRVACHIGGKSCSPYGQGIARQLIGRNLAKI